MRESRDRQRGRPSVSKARQSLVARGEWRTLREAAELTGIPIGTLRKWCRRGTVDSYLESDGDLTLRMVEMESVRARAASLGRDRLESAPVADPSVTTREKSPVAGGRSPETSGTHGAIPDAEPGTMIVPIDAWNKMLNQLGNLHEAGQQLAEARERAAKAETEARFLRERLAEMRDAAGQVESPVARSSESPVGEAVEVHDSDVGTAPGSQDASTDAETVTFWRYVVRGWRGRRT